MDYKSLIWYLRRAPNSNIGMTPVQPLEWDAADAIADLSSRLEKAENHVKELFSMLNNVCRDVREKTVQNYVCGLCEYDGAYISENGDWMNECPGFERNDCFCMKKSLREKYGMED